MKSVLVKMNSAGGGDVLCITPVLQALKKKYLSVDLETNWPDIFKNNPHVILRNNGKYDKIIDFDLFYASKDLICQEAAKQAGVELEDTRPQIFLSERELMEGSKALSDLKWKGTVVGCALRTSRTRWDGRNWPHEHIRRFVRLLRERGAQVVEIGKDVESTGEASLNLVNKTSLREMFSVVANLDFFVGIDSLPLHVAQAFSIPSLVLFGAVEPTARVVNFSKTCVVRNEKLLCLGCYQQKSKNASNQCTWGNEACMTELTPEMVINHLSQILVF